MTQPCLTTKLAVLLAIIGAAAVGMAAAAQAETAQAAWPTWLRAGPGNQYVVIDEVARGDRFEVLGCANGWCRAELDRSTGYISQDLVSQTGSALQGKAAQGQVGSSAQPCFDARRAGYEDGRTYSFCPK